MLPPDLQQIDRTYVLLGKKRLTYFGGCDYFRLASHPQVLSAMCAGLKRYGLNVAASRKTTGNHALYAQLEQKLARFFAVPGALLVGNGYVTNFVVAQALTGQFSHVLIDELAHASLQDATRFFDCPILKFQHRNAESVAQLIARIGSIAKPILLTDGMFSHDGSVAPLKAYLRALPKHGMILADDAHGAGVLGQKGQGSVELTGVSRQRVIQTITLSKAFGVYGGAILANRNVLTKCVEQSRLFGGHTPLPLPLANAALTAVEILQRDRSIRLRLKRNIEHVKGKLAEAGFGVEPTPTPIIAFKPRNGRHTAKLKAALLKARIYPSFIRYPGGPRAGYFRFAISSEHTLKQLDAFVSVLISAHC